MASRGRGEPGTGRAGDGASRGRGVGAGGAGGVASLSPVMGNGGIEAVNDE